MKPQASLCVFVLLFCQDSDAFSIVSSSHRVHTSVGETVRLTCRSDEYFEFCSWRTAAGSCHFEWKASHDRVVRMHCPLGDRIRFTGDYEAHECEIEVPMVGVEDEGRWECEMEKYTWGPSRGQTDKNTVFLKVERPGNIAPFATTTTSTSSTTTTSPSTSSLPPKTSIPASQAPTALNTTEQDVTNNQPSPDAFPVAAVIGGIVGALALTVIVGLVVFVVRRRKRIHQSVHWKQKKEEGTEGIYEENDVVFVRSDSVESE